MRLGPLGYAAAARESFATFSRLKGDSLIPTDMRFQVCLPTPLAVISNFPLDQQRVLSSIYEARLKQEVEDMLDVIPADELAIQWDAAIEFAVLEGVVPSAYGSPSESRQPLLDAMLRLAAFVPARSSSAITCATAMPAQALQRASRHCAPGGRGQRRLEGSASTSDLAPLSGADRPRRRHLLRAAARSPCRTRNGGVRGAGA